MNSDLRDLIGRDEPLGNDGDTPTPGYAQPVSQSEIEELLYSEEWPPEERIARLTAIRDELVNIESPDLEHDPQALVHEINTALARLQHHDAEGMDPISVDHDPSVHRETLSPDSDELEAIEEEDEASLTEDEETAIDKSQWINGEGIDPESGAG